MRFLLFLLIFFSIQLCNAQDKHLVRIVSHDGDITLDGTPVESGQLISSASNKLIISKKASYAYVLTQNGYTMKLESGSYDVGEIEKFIYKKKYKERSTLTMSVHSDPPPLSLIGIDGQSTIFLMNDSIYLRWKKTRGINAPIKLPYELKFSTLFEESLSESKVNENFIKANLRQMAGKEFMVIVSINNGDCLGIGIRFVESEISTQILNDVSKIISDPIQKSILDLVVYDDNDLILDLMFKLDKISKIETAFLPIDLKNYLSLLKTKYEFN